MTPRLEFQGVREFQEDRAFQDDLAAVVPRRHTINRDNKFEQKTL